jgi:hypothetical protein
MNPLQIQFKNGSEFIRFQFLSPDNKLINFIRPMSFISSLRLSAPDSMQHLSDLDFIHAFNDNWNSYKEVRNAFKEIMSYFKVCTYVNTKGQPTEKWIAEFNSTIQEMGESFWTSYLPERFEKEIKSLGVSFKIIEVFEPIMNTVESTIEKQIVISHNAFDSNEKDA